MVPLAQWAQDLDASAVYKRLRDNFGACCQKEVLYVKYGKAMAHLCSQSVKIDPILLRKFGWDCWGGRSRFIRDAFMAGRDAYRRMTQEGNASHRANVRTALRTMAVHGLDQRLSLPDSEELIWNDDSMPQGVNAQLLDSLSRALFNAVRPSRRTDHYNESDTPFHEERDGRYINLIFSLAKNGEWRQRLIHDGHLQRCIDLVDEVSRTYPSESYLPGFYLPAIIGRINPDTTLSTTQKKSLRQLVEKTWRAHIYRNDDDYVDAIPALVTATKLIFQQEMWLATEARGALEYIQEQQTTLVNNGVAQATVDAALSSLEDFHEKLQSVHVLDLRNKP
ncbi:hypothetical protein CY34DRAFT_106512 [Suillus luteus UH-Slu-Lm8-n1]|uniref:Uncharacterized protein n=1 Tax=Suillus luteus UH-Slu-Lm8-n1 TaxID=930992 RepID=A0A0D0BA73_9AGAM|nr:hypothetical protein CY34DRAFT_106512 [Suillus luteus UH-Slu-Lm8-n1]